MLIIDVKGKISLKIPYKDNLSTIAAKIIDTPNGDSVWAFNNQEFNPYNGVFTAKAINIPQNKTIKIELPIITLKINSKEIMPINACSFKIANNKNNEPNTYLVCFWC